MKRPTILLLAASAFTICSSRCVRAQQPAAATSDKTAEEIVESVHLSRALRDDTVLPGVLTKGGRSVPFTVTLKDSLLRFVFENPRQIINLDITDKGYRLREVSANTNREIPAAMYSTGVRGTDLTYDDISMRYLYWPKKVKVGEETIKTQRCYVVDLINPPQQRLGEYYLVRIFVHKKTGGLMRMQAYDWNGKKIKVCAVTEGMKINGATVLKTMDVIRYVPGTEKVVGETFLELKKP